MTAPSSPPPSTSKRAALVSSLLGVGIAVAGLAFVIRRLAADWEETQALIEGANPVFLIAAIGVALVAVTLIGLPWRNSVALLGHPADYVSTLRWYFPGQLGKYVPGGIWPVVGRAELAIRGGVPRSIAYGSVALSISLTYLAAVLAVMMLIPVVALGGEAQFSGLWVLVLLPAGLGLLHPAVLQRLVALAERVLNRNMVLDVPEWQGTVRLLVQHTPAWLLIAGATWLVARAFVADPDVAQIMLAAVVSWIIGFIVIPAPGGIGIREAAFVAAATSLPDETAAAAAIMARLCFVAADLLGAAIVVIGIRRTRPAESLGADPSDSSPEGSSR